MATTVPSEEPRLSRRYVGGNTYRWFIVGARSLQIIDEKDFHDNDEATARKYFDSLKLAWDTRKQT